MPVFQPQLEQRSAPTYVKPGVVDKSTAGLIENLGEIATEGYSQYQEYALESKIEEEMDQHFAGVESGQKAVVFQEGGLEGSFQRELDKYKQAKDEGRIDVRELEARILARTREAINRNPGLTSRLLKRADQVLELSGAASYINASKEAQKAEQDQLAKVDTEIRSQLYQKGIPFNPYNLDRAWAVNELNKRQVQIATYEAFKRDNEINKIRTAEEASALVQQRGHDAFLGSISSFGQAAVATYQNLEKKDAASASAMLDNLANNYLNEWYAWGARNRVAENPEYKLLTQRLETSLKNTKERMSKVTGGEDYLSILKKEVETLQLTQQKSLLEKYDVASLDLLSKFDPEFIKEYVLKSGKNSNQIYDLVGDLASGFMTNEAVKSLTSKTTGRTEPDAVVILGETIKIGDKQAVSSMLGSFNQGYAKIADNNQKLQFLESSVKEIGKLTNQENLKGLDAKATESGMNLVSTYMGQVTRNLLVGLSDLPQGVTAKFDVLPDGKLNIIVNDPTIQDKLNKAYLPRINDSLQAMANLHGVDPKAISKDFYTNYFKPMWPEVMGDTDIATVSGIPEGTGFKITTREEAADLFKRGVINQDAYNQLAAFLPTKVEATQQEATIKRQEEIKRSPETNPPQWLSLEEQQKQFPDHWSTKLMQIDKQLAEWTNSILKTRDAAVDAVVGPWVRLLEQGLISEREYRKRVRQKAGIEK